MLDSKPTEPCYLRLACDVWRPPARVREGSAVAYLGLREYACPELHAGARLRGLRPTVSSRPGPFRDVRSVASLRLRGLKRSRSFGRKLGYIPVDPFSIALGDPFFAYDFI